MRVDEKRLVEIEARAAAAMPGPWTGDGPDPEGNFYVRETRSGETMVALITATTLRVRTPQDAKDTTFIASARADVPDLAADLRETRALLTEAIVALDQTNELDQAELAASLLDRSGLPTPPGMES